MTDIVQKVARAICAESWHGVTSPKEIERLVDAHWPAKADAAHVAITTLLKAMEEPSEGMKEAGQMGLMAEMHPAAGAYKAMLAKFREERGL